MLFVNERDANTAKAVRRLRGEVGERKGCISNGAHALQMFTSVNGEPTPPRANRVAPTEGKRRAQMRASGGKGKEMYVIILRILANRRTHPAVQDRK